MIVNNILLASDFSTHADWALQRAIELAKNNNAHIHFLHVMASSLSNMLSSESEMQRAYAVKKEEIEEKISTAVNGTGAGLFANTSVVSGRAADEIVRYAADRHCELIVVGAHGNYYINDYVLGTTSGSIIRQSPVPVLLIKKEPDFVYDRILITTDLSDASKETVQFTFKCFPEATFQLLHIVDIYYRQFFNPMDVSEELVAPKHPTTRKVLEKLDNFLDQCHVDKSRFERKIIGGYHADAITEQANKWQADLLAFGTQGKSRLHYLLMGSVAKRILHLSHVDMLAVPPGLSLKK